MSDESFRPFYQDGILVQSGDRVRVGQSDIRIIGKLYGPEHHLSKLIDAIHGCAEISPSSLEELPFDEDVKFVEREMTMNTFLERLEYGFDRDSRRTRRRRVLATAEDEAYGYDGLSQVINAARGTLNLNATAIGGVPATGEAWDYDPTGNWRGYRVEENGAVTLEQERVHDKGNRLMQIQGGGAGTVLVDRAGRMRQVPPDAGGNWNDPLELVWDAWNRLVEVRQGGSTVGSYTYDGLSRRTTRTTGGVTWHSYYSDAWRPLEERLDSQTTAAKQYYWGARHRDDLVRRDRATTSGGALDETRYVLMDYFSPAAITDGSGNVKERYAFSSFGMRRILAPDFSERSTSECDWSFGFQGQFLDSESGFYDFGYRYYSPGIGRWTSKDPIEERSGLNLYAFAENDGVNFVDFLGLQSCCKSQMWNGEVSYQVLGFVYVHGSFSGKLTCTSDQSLKASVSGSADGFGALAGRITGKSTVGFSAETRDKLVGQTTGVFTASVGLGIGPVNIIDVSGNVGASPTTPALSATLDVDIGPGTEFTPRDVLKKPKPGLGGGGGFIGLQIKQAS